MNRKNWPVLTGALAVLALMRCSCPLLPGDDDDNKDPPRGDGYTSVYSVDTNTVVVSFSRKVDKGTVNSGAFDIWDRTVIPAKNLAIGTAETVGPAQVKLFTAPQEFGRTYTLTIHGLKDDLGFSLDGSLNFQGGGSPLRTRVTLRIDDLPRANGWGPLAIQVNVDPASGAFAEQYFSVDPTTEGAVQEVTLDIDVNPRRTVDRRDDADTGTDRRAYAARVWSKDKELPASALVPFEVSTLDPVTVILPLFEPPVSIPDAGPIFRCDSPEDPNPADGVARIRLCIDDRVSKELDQPALWLSVDEQGAWNSDPGVEFPLQQVQGPGIYETIVDVKVDPNRVNSDPDDPDTMAYVVVLVSGGRQYRAVFLMMPVVDETPQGRIFPLGSNPTGTPVTFRVDVGCSLVKWDGSVKGHYPSESIFLAGEWNAGATDAFGNNAQGSFLKGGENPILEMKKDPDHPGVWFKTLWLKPGRPYGWKVLRCTSKVGCGALNKLVISSGSAYATVMKNLVTHPEDANRNPEYLINACDLAHVQLNGQQADYTNATVHAGQTGESYPTPGPTVMFKQEVPDLLVNVTSEPLITPIYTIGTWRDVNLPQSTEKILEDQQSINIAPYDYDDGLTGVEPPTRSQP